MKNTFLFQLAIVSSMSLMMYASGLTSFTPSTAELPTADKSKLFQRFINHFPSAELPFVIDAERLNEMSQLDIDSRELKSKKSSLGSEAQHISSEFAEFIPAMQRGRYSRMGPDVFKYEAVIAQNDGYIGIIYARQRPFSAAATSFYLATYTPSGKQIDDVKFADRNGFQNFTTGAIDIAGNVKLKSCENIWEKDLLEYGYKDNKIKGQECHTEIDYVLSDKGKLTELKTVPKQEQQMQIQQVRSK